MFGNVYCTSSYLQLLFVFFVLNYVQTVICVSRLYIMYVSLCVSSK